MNQDSKQQINLPEGITVILTENVDQIKKLQSEIQVYNQRISDVMTGVCLSKEIDLKKDQISFSEDFKILYVQYAPKQEISEETPEETIKPKSKVKKMDAKQ